VEEYDSGLTMPLYIVIFGAAVRPDGSPSGTLARRVRAAWACGRSYADTRYLVSGGITADGFAEWQVMRRQLLQLGVPAKYIATETEGVDTLHQVRNCIRILAAHSVGEDELWIATSRYHQARCWALFAAHGIQTHVVPSLPDRFDLPLRKLLWFWVREFFALPYDVFMTIVTPRTDPNSAIR